MIASFFNFAETSLIRYYELISQNDKTIIFPMTPF